MLENISLEDSKNRLISIIDFYKDKEKFSGELFKVSFSRQDLANMTGLRVETVIRSIKKLEEENELSIKNGKIYRFNNK